jgi:hypothetical protein
MKVDGPGDSISADAQLTVVGRLHELFGQRGIDYWLFGGWAVDFHAGRVTRPHADIDIAVWHADFDRVDSVLREEAWDRHVEPGEDGYTHYRHGASHLDVAFLARDADGCVYTPLREGRGEWSAGAFDNDTVQLLGVRARVVSVASLLADKSERRDDPLADMKDRADVAALGRLGHDG